jgi:hypothetical protein
MTGPRGSRLDERFHLSAMVPARILILAEGHAHGRRHTTDKTKDWDNQFDQLCLLYSGPRRAGLAPEYGPGLRRAAEAGDPAPLGECGTAISRLETALNEAPSQGALWRTHRSLSVRCFIISPTRDSVRRAELESVKSGNRKGFALRSQTSEMHINAREGRFTRWRALISADLIDHTGR